MKTTLIFFFIFNFLILESFANPNLLDNGDFENTNFNLSAARIGYLFPPSWNWKVYSGIFGQGKSSVYHPLLEEYFTSPVKTLITGEGYARFIFFQSINQGQGYPYETGMAYTSINQKLKSGQKYKISFYLASPPRQYGPLEQAAWIIKGYTLDSVPTSGSYNFYQDTQKAFTQAGLKEVITTPSFFRNKDWTEFSQTFVATGKEKYFGLGNLVYQPARGVDYQCYEEQDCLNNPHHGYYLDQIKLECAANENIDELLPLMYAHNSIDQLNIQIDNLADKKFFNINLDQPLADLDIKLFQVVVHHNGTSSTFPYHQFLTAYQNSNGDILSFLKELGYEPSYNEIYYIKLLYPKQCGDGLIQGGDIHLKISDYSTKGKIEMFPSPLASGDTVYIRLESTIHETKLQYELIDATGKLLEQNIIDIAGEKVISLKTPDNLSAGINYYRLSFPRVGIKQTAIVFPIAVVQR